MSDQPKKSTVGPPMYVESLMTTMERMKCRREYKTYVRTWSPTAFPTDEGFKWRYGMGGPLTEQEIQNINGNIDYLLTIVGRASL